MTAKGRDSEIERSDASGIFVIAVLAPDRFCAAWRMPLARSSRQSKGAIARSYDMPSSVAKKLGINLASQREGELFKWFLACLLFGKPIQQEIAERAYFQLVSAGLRKPDAILAAGWDELVRLLDEAHYVRYDFSTASKLLEVFQQLKQRYGSVTKLIEEAKTASELSDRLQTFTHIGPVTARIFTEEVAPIWYRSRGSRRAARKSRSSRPRSAN